MINDQTSAISSNKPHFEVLDGLRGVAAIIVLDLHFREPLHLAVGHGYLAVDFFFLLSGFVMGYAYDDRWNRGMTIGNFIKRRLIRLHPMVIFGTLLGALLAYLRLLFLPCAQEVSVGTVLFFTLLGILMIPVRLPASVYNGNMYPFNSPIWSLAFEYCANILYATVIRRFSKVLLFILVALSAVAILCVCFTRGDISAGFVSTKPHLIIGFIRVIFSFFGGLLLYRLGGLIKVRHAFIICSLALVILLMVVPQFLGEHRWMNGLFEACMILIVFPAIVYIGASATHVGERMSKCCNRLGRLSYPIYLLKFPTPFRSQLQRIHLSKITILQGI